MWSGTPQSVAEFDSKVSTRPYRWQDVRRFEQPKSGRFSEDSSRLECKFMLGICRCNPSSPIPQMSQIARIRHATRVQLIMLYLSVFTSVRTTPANSVNEVPSPSTHASPDEGATLDRAPSVTFFVGMDGCFVLMGVGNYPTFVELAEGVLDAPYTSHTHRCFQPSVPQVICSRPLSACTRPTLSLESDFGIAEALLLSSGHRTPKVNQGIQNHAPVPSSWS